MAVVGALTIAVVFGWGLARFGDSLVDSARAQSVADAVAMVIASGGSDAPSSPALRANRAELESVLRSDTWVEVVVVVDGARARARASIALP